MSALTVGSLFSGIGGIDLGLERAGFRIVWQCEIDEYCQKVLRKHWPDVTRYGDIRTVGKHNLSTIDILAGGFPCQDISIAGKRTGITGAQSGLWKEFYRLICELRPRYVLVENVAALLNWGIDTVLGDLAACGYDAEWACISAASVGAPHIRERVFIIAYPASQQDRGLQQRGVQSDTFASYQDVSNSRRTTNGMEIYRSRGQERQSPISSKSTLLRQEYGPISSKGIGASSQDVPDPDRQSLAVGQVFRSDTAKELAAFKRSCGTGGGQWAVEPGLGRMVDGVPARVDRLRGLGNAVVPQCIEFIGRCIIASIGQEQVS